MLKHGSGGGGALPQGQRMVTTVRQTQAVYDIASPSPGNLLAGGSERAAPGVGPLVSECDCVLLAARLARRLGASQIAARAPQ